MDSVIVNALKKKRKLELELSKINLFIETYEELTGNKIKRDELLSQSDEAYSTEKLATKSTDSPRRRNNIKKLLDVAAQLIREAGRPLTRGEIAQGMERLNVIVHAVDKPKYIGTLLWRNKRLFRSTDGDGYELVDGIVANPTPPAYAPQPLVPQPAPPQIRRPPSLSGSRFLK